MSTSKDNLLSPDQSTENLMRQLIEDEQALIEAADECRKWEEEEQRLKARVGALKKAIEILA